MPEISRFLGMLITMYYNDHEPAHFHVRYGAQKATIDIEASDLLDGALSARALALIGEWTNLHRLELLDNWRRARRHEHLSSIAPLD
ncbi:MAG: DUF4160 domain-containing protein [Bryobacteraceae bacterium]